MRDYGLSVLPLAALYLFAASALAQEVEPNDACPGQHIGMPALPASMPGHLETRSDLADVDFYRFDFTPGDELVAGLEGEPTGAGTLSDPLLGLFDSGCSLISANDDGPGTVNSRLVFPVPDDGVVILAATSYADFDFEGNGFSAGTYTLTIATAPPSIHSIRGRVVDARDGQPLSGDEPTFAAVTLSRCDGDVCQDVGLEIPDAQGQFTFSGASYGLTVGQYQLSATAVGYQEGQQAVSEPFQVDAGEQYDFGDIRLEPNELQITGVELCDALPPEGGVCAYSLEMRNRGDSPFSGRVWSLVDYGLPGTGVSYAFQVGTGNSHTPEPKYIWVEPERAERVTFYLRISPAWTALDDGGFACISVGIGRAPFAVQNVAAGVFIGCLTRRSDGLELVPLNGMSPQLKAKTADEPMTLQGVRPKPNGRFRR